jgi:hypothetical protein
MKTRFSINNEIFGRRETLEDMYKYYERYYKKQGFILDKINENVYKEFDREIHLNEGDRVDLEGVFRLVEWKCIDLDKNIIRYELIEE